MFLLPMTTSRALQQKPPDTKRQEHHQSSAQAKFAAKESLSVKAEAQPRVVEEPAQNSLETLSSGYFETAKMLVDIHIHSRRAISVEVSVESLNSANAGGQTEAAKPETIAAANILVSLFAIYLFGV
mmetsp:Transcript_7581/g.12410  ORF Transcript_7581/g.12410 Transcript_7581/m.12410 type:complete len:127 (-) Transcript_7581:645-1025(-)